MPKHPNFTHGPWKIKGYAGEHDEAGANIVGSDGIHVCHTSYLLKNTPEGWAEYYANAHLIAAAPELYTALELARRYVVSHSPAALVSDVRMIDDALAKARGK